MQYKRVHILGCVASGKTTLARDYARKARIPHFDLDKIMFSDVIARKFRPGPERDKLLEKATLSEEWVTEGVYVGEWVAPAFKRAEKIVMLNIPERTCHYRVIKRQTRWLTKNLARYDRFLPTLVELMKFNRQYQHGLYQHSLNVLSEFDEKVVICDNNRDAVVELAA